VVILRGAVRRSEAVILRAADSRSRRIHNNPACGLRVNPKTQDQAIGEPPETYGAVRLLSCVRLGICSYAHVPCYSCAACALYLNGHYGFSRFPVAFRSPASEAQRLQPMATPSKFGQGEQTLLDTSARDCGEFSPDQLRLDWDDAARDAPFGRGCHRAGRAAAERAATQSPNLRSLRVARRPSVANPK